MNISRKIRVLQPDGSWKVIGLLVAVPIKIHPELPEFVGIGMSLCHEADEYCKETAYQMAEDRAYEYEETYRYKWRKSSPFSLHGQLLPIACVQTQVGSFINQCEKFYKDKSIILPRFEFHL